MMVVDGGLQMPGPRISAAAAAHGFAVDDDRLALACSWLAACTHHMPTALSRPCSRVRIADYSARPVFPARPAQVQRCYAPTALSQTTTGTRPVSTRHQRQHHRDVMAHPAAITRHSQWPAWPSRGPCRTGRNQQRRQRWPATGEPERWFRDMAKIICIVASPTSQR